MAEPRGRRTIDPDVAVLEGDRPHLLGSTCRTCGAVTFPAQSSCPRCTGGDTTVGPLPRHGTLWSFTVQGFPPKEPYVEAEGPFRPFGVGYVDLGDVLVEARLTGDPAALAIGRPMELVTETLIDATGGGELLTYAFAPTGSDEPEPGAAP